jgi:hypothetical protein
MYTLKEAGDVTGMSKSTIFKAIKKGTISASKHENGQWMIEPCELHRVYPPLNSNEVIAEVSVENTRHETQESAVNQRGNTDELVAELRGTVADLRRRLDESEAERRVTQEKLTLLLTHQPQAIEHTKTPPKKVNAWVWIALGIACISAVIVMTLFHLNP